MGLKWAFYIVLLIYIMSIGMGVFFIFFQDMNEYSSCLSWGVIWAGASGIFGLLIGSTTYHGTWGIPDWVRMPSWTSQMGPVDSDPEALPPNDRIDKPDENVIELEEFQEDQAYTNSVKVFRKKD